MKLRRTMRHIQAPWTIVDGTAAISVQSQNVLAFHSLDLYALTCKPCAFAEGPQHDEVVVARRPAQPRRLRGELDVRLIQDHQHLTHDAESHLSSGFCTLHALSIRSNCGQILATGKPGINMFAHCLQ